MTRLNALLIVALLGVGPQRGSAQGPLDAPPKRLLLVTTTLGFRHSSIEVGEKLVRELAKRTGEFTVVSTSESPDFPDYTQRGGPGGGGPAPGFGRDSEQTEKVRKVLGQYLSREALNRYDGVFFLNTTGELPVPDLPALIQWIEEGHGFVGSHSASDTLHQSPAYLGFIGGEFAGHGAQATVDLFNVDPKHPANARLGSALVVHEEMYLFKNYEQSRVHPLLNMNAHPNNKTAGHYPVSWSKEIGKGRVFYTSLGHRVDIWDPAWKDRDGKRENSPEVSETFQKHLLDGIRWALRIDPAARKR